VKLRDLILLPAILGLVTGCKFADVACGGPPEPAIRLHAKDGQTGEVIVNPTVNATIVGMTGRADVVAGMPGDPSIVRIFGVAGVYALTVTKAGYGDIAQRVEVGGTGGSCATTFTVDVTVTMLRAQ
jgi:hypothetical protein